MDSLAQPGRATPSSGRAVTPEPGGIDRRVCNDAVHSNCASGTSAVLRRPQNVGGLYSRNHGAHAAWDLSSRCTSAEFRRLFSLYLAYCEGSFLERHISDVQLLLAKSSWRDELKERSFR